MSFEARRTLQPWTLYEATLLLLCVALVSWQLFLPPTLGVADNNDFPKLLGKFCLGPAVPGDHRLFEYVTFSYRRDNSYCWNSELITSAVLPLSVALQTAKLVPPPGWFDLRILGAIYALLFLAAFHGLQRLARGLRSPARWSLPAVALLIFGGASYVPLFNSFYFDAAAYVFLLLSIVAVCWLVFSPAVRTWEYFLAAGCMVLFATSKSQHAPLALLMTPGLWCSFGRALFPGCFARFLATAAVVLAVGATLTLPPPWYKTINIYNALFFQCLPRSPDARADLARLGVDPALLKQVGRHAFSADSPMQDQRLVEEFGRQFPLRKMIGYYLSHPRVALSVLLYALEEGSLQRVRMKVGQREYRLGNYAKTTGRPPQAQSHFLDLWSQFKVAIFGNRPLLYLVSSIGLLTALWTLVLRQPAQIRMRAATLTMALTGMLTLAAVIVMFDAVETGRHLFLFNTLLDVTVCAIVAVI